MIIAIAALLLFIMVSVGLSSCGAMFSGSMNSVLGTSYTSEDSDLVATEQSYAAMENELQSEIDNIETTHSGYDEYRYDLDTIGHNPHELASYLTALLQSYTPQSAQAELKRLFGLQYTLTLTEEIEIRTTTDEEGNEEEYEYRILNVKLTNKPIASLAEELLNPQQFEMFKVYLQTQGNKPLIFGGGSPDGSPSEDLSGVEFVNGTRPGMQMKNKLKKTMTALCAALILMGGFSVPAYAQGAATEPPAGDATNDSNVVVEEKEETPPLTPKGNATLVDDYGGNKQLITVTTKGGNYFYILIDRAAEGEQTVHFLNQVDEADLMALTENGEAAKKPEICNCTEKCEAGKVNTSCPVCVTSMTGCTGKEPTPTPTEQPEEPKGKGGNPGVVLALVLFALLGGGAAFYYFKFLKPKQNVKGDTDLEDFEFEDYDEDEPEADTGETPEDEETEEETL